MGERSERRVRMNRFHSGVGYRRKLTRPLSHAMDGEAHVQRHPEFFVQHLFLSLSTILKLLEFLDHQKHEPDEIGFDEIRNEPEEQGVASGAKFRRRGGRG